MTWNSQGQAGNAVQYVTRNQALKKLQLKLSEFRRLCILKGIHPREPKKKVQGAHKTYYHVKDIAFLLHEPLLNKIRELYAHEKKIKRAIAKKNRPLASRLAQRKPEYRLDHVIKERYPSLIDALRNLDDPLTLVHLFAVLPSDGMKGISADRVQLSRRLVLEWQAYVVASHSLRKCFVSVKGFYYQAEIKGQEITWMIPHQVSQVLPQDVDFKVMMTFLELYQSTLKFVLFSLYHEMGVEYPPMVDDAIDSTGVLSIGNTSNTAAGVQKSQREQKLMKKLEHKAAELEKEIRSMDGANNTEGREDPNEGGEDNVSEDNEDVSGDDDDSLPEIDDGEEEEEESDDDDDVAEDPSDDDIPVHVAKDAAEDNGKTKKNSLIPELSEVDRSLIGGAIDVADEEGICSSLFQGLKFFLGREVPKEQLALVIQSFGGVVGWDGEGSPFDEMDNDITHQVIDRPKPLIEHKDRLFVQPQWVFDSANARILMHTSKYSPGLRPPPHLSPFVQTDDEEYVPEYAKEIQALKDAAQRARQKAAGEAVDDEFFGTSKGTTVQPDKEMELAEIEELHAKELAKELNETTGKEVANPVTPSGIKRGRDEKDDEEAMKDIMMTRKVKQVYQKAMKEKAAKRVKTQKLQRKAASLKK